MDERQIRALMANPRSNPKRPDPKEWVKVRKDIVDDRPKTTNVGQEVVTSDDEKDQYIIRVTKKVVYRTVTEIYKKRD